MVARAASSPPSMESSSATCHAQMASHMYTRTLCLALGASLCDVEGLLPEWLLLRSVHRRRLGGREARRLVELRLQRNAHAVAQAVELTQLVEARREAPPLLVGERLRVAPTVAQNRTQRSGR